MISSGIKRGLAATAVSALAVAGLPFLASSASADSYLDQIADNDAVLYSQYSGAASVQNDGTNTTVHLLAGGGENVAQVRFEYSATGVAPFTTIATVSRTNGAFSTEWTPPTGIYNLPTTVVRAVPVSTVGTDLAGVDSATVTVGSNSPAVDIANAPGSTVGVFDQPYSEAGQSRELGVISGKTSDVSGGATVDVSNLTTGVPTGTQAATLDAAAGGLRTFTGAVDFSGYNWDAVAPLVNQAVVGAESGSDDAELVNLTQQTITTVTATVSPATVQGAGTATGTVTVTDQTGAPVSGAQVFYDADNDGVHDAGETFQYTNAKGQASFPGLTGSAAGTQHAFVVNTTDSDDYDVATDFRRTATVTSYTPTATSLAAASKDGDAFDLDEYDAAPGANGEGDLTVTVKDQSGAPLAGQPLTGKWTITAFGAATSTTQTATITDTDNDGVYDVALPAGGVEGTYKLDVWKEQDGTPGQSAGDLSAAPLTFKAGEANVTWTDGVTAQAPAGTTATFKGKIALDDGTVLPNRNVAFAWAPTGNAVVAAQASQPAGTTRTGDNSATATAGATGEFAVAISDPAATPQLAELNGSLTVNSANTPAFGTNTDASDTLDVDFLADSAVDADQSYTDAWNLGGSATPGRPVHVEINVENAAGTSLTDLPVTVKTDHGFFTTPGASQLSELKADPAAADGAKYGEWENLGTTFSTSTDDSGYAEAVVAIERDAGFDDDGQVTANVTFTVGGKTFTRPVTFNSSNPLNAGEVTITLDETQTVSDATLPKAPTTEELDWNVHATDQWGNLTEVLVDLSDNGSDADLSTGSTWTNFTDDNPNLETSSDETADQTVTGTWNNAPTTTWKDLDPATAGFQGDTDVADSTVSPTKTVTGASETISWYTIDFAASTYSLTHTGSDTQPVGTTVTETYKAVDQNGEPIQGLSVEFFRTGPDDLGDGDGNDDMMTNSQGEAYYVFQGAKAGTATTTAVVYIFNGTDWVLVPQAEETDVVKFGGEIVDPNLKVTGSGGAKDTVKADAISAAAGATATVWVGGKKVATKTLNGSGNAKFTIKDKNGNKATKYVVKITATAQTTADKASKKIK